MVGPAPPAAPATDQWQLGASVQLRTSTDEEVQGVVFAYDPTSGTLLLKEKGAHNGVVNLRLLNAAHVAATLRADPPTGPVDLELPPVDMERCRRREEKALKLAEAEYERVGVGVSKEAQAIFEALSKTLPCSWRNQKTICVLDEVLVPEPYTAESCSAVGRLSNPKALDRVRMIVREARFRLGLTD